MTLAARTSPEETETRSERRRLVDRLADVLAAGRRDFGRVVHALAAVARAHLVALYAWAVTVGPRRTAGWAARLSGGAARGIGRRALAVAVSGRWDYPLLRLAGFSPRAYRIVLAAAWAVGVPVALGASAATPLLVSPAVGYLAVVVAAREYAKSARGRVRGEYGFNGWATYVDLARSLTRTAVRRAAVSTRPSLEEKTRGAFTARPAARLISRIPVAETGTWLGKTAVGPWAPISLYAAHKDVVGTIAPPQTAKSAWLGHAIIDHPGAVVSASTKPDLYGHTADLRRLVSLSGDVEMFNPEGLGGIPSTFAWSPLAGCEVAYVATERAGAMVGATSAAGGEDGQFWLDSAAKVLRCLLLAAALDSRTMTEVAAWISNHQRALVALDILEASPHRLRVPEGWALELGQVLSTSATKTRESIFLTLAQSVAFMADPAVAALCTPAADAPAFDVAAFLEDRGTLYLVGAEREHAPIAPLLAALTSHVFEEAKRIAARANAKGRLDPPLLLALDEAALTTLVALDRWTADAGGRGIHIIWSVQSRSQLAQRWGARGADTIWNNTNAKLVFGGLTLVDDLEDVSRLCGKVSRSDEDGKTRQVPLLPVERLRELPQWHAVLVHRNTKPTVVRVSPVWERRDVRHSASPESTSHIDDRVASRRIGEQFTEGEAA